MAKSVKSPRPVGPDPAALLEGLRKALAGPKPFRGAGEALFPKGAKGEPQAQAALAEGYLTTRMELIPPAGKKSKEVEVAELTDKGRRHVLESDSPKAALEALLPAVQRLVEEREAPRHPAVQACVKAIEDSYAKLQKSIEAALAKLEQAIVKAAPPSRPPLDAGPILASVQTALARLSHPVAPGISAAKEPAPSLGPQPAAAPAEEPATAIGAEQLRSALREAYDHLCLFVEFRDRLVEIPRLYHEALRRMPGLSVPRFHQELEFLSSERKVELHKLNEVHTAKERHLAIDKDDRLYYYILWK